jgi:hypothetical protein
MRQWDVIRVYGYLREVVARWQRTVGKQFKERRTFSAVENCRANGRNLEQWGFKSKGPGKSEEKGRMEMDYAKGERWAQTLF